MDSTPFVKEDDLLSQADFNLVQQLKLRMQSSSSGSVYDSDGLFKFSVGLPVANGYVDGYSNGILRLTNEPPANEVLHACAEFFQTLGHSYVLWIRDHADREIEKILQDRGLVPLEQPGIPAMVNRQRAEIPSMPPGVSVRLASNESDALDYARVFMRAFDRSWEVSQLAFGNINGLMGPGISAYIASLDGKPASVAMVVLTGEIAGVYNVGTIPEARGHGLGTLCTALATNRGFDLGAHLTILQSSSIGQHIYERLGYKVFTYYRWYTIDDPSKIL